MLPLALPHTEERLPKKNTKDAFDRIDAEGVSAAAERGERGDNVQEHDGSIERGETQLLLADAGEIMSHLRVSTQPIQPTSAQHKHHTRRESKRTCSSAQLRRAPRQQYYTVDDFCVDRNGSMLGFCLCWGCRWCICRSRKSLVSPPRVPRSCSNSSGNAGSETGKPKHHEVRVVYGNRQRPYRFIYSSTAPES